MKENVLNDSDRRYNEVEFLKMYLEYFHNLIDENVEQSWKIEESDTKLYQFCVNCIHRIELLIDYSMKQSIDCHKPSEYSFDIAVAYQTLLEYMEEERFHNSNTNVSVDIYARSKRVLLKHVDSENAEIVRELCHSMEEEIPEYSESISSHELKASKHAHYHTLLESIQTLKQLNRFRELQNLENTLFFTTPQESDEELKEIISCYIRK